MAIANIALGISWSTATFNHKLKRMFPLSDMVLWLFERESVVCGSWVTSCGTATLFAQICVCVLFCICVCEYRHVCIFMSQKFLFPYSLLKIHSIVCIFFSSFPLYCPSLPPHFIPLSSAVPFSPITATLYYSHSIGELYASCQGKM